MARRFRRLGGLALVAAALAAVYLAAPALRGLLPVTLEFEPVADPPGFRRLVGDSEASRVDPFVGLDAPPAAAAGEIESDLCRAVFGDAPPPGVVPVAAFSDFRCPFCRVLDPILAELDREGLVRVNWREWPLLGRASEEAARAVVAAERLGASRDFHARLMSSSFAPTPAYLAELAQDAGIDPARLAEEMDTIEVTRHIEQSRALARLLGFPGTPSLVVGRTLVVGAIDEPTLRELVEREAEAGPPPVCAKEWGS